MADFDERPAKKRRFFDSVSPDTTTSALASTSAEQPQATGAEQGVSVINDGFDLATLSAVIGEELTELDIQKLKSLSGSNLERAINIYLDGSWRVQRSEITTNNSNEQPQKSILAHKEDESSRSDTAKTEARPAPEPRSNTPGVPPERYMGAFGATGWATRSGYSLLKHGDKVGIERARPQAPTKQKGRGFNSKKHDIVVRFTNPRGEEVGRLENETAYWVSTLIDQNLCRFSGTCVYVPERIRSSDTIYLQIRCYFRRSAFEENDLLRVQENDRPNLFESKESTGEKALRLRQVALVRLFEDINLHPTTAPKISDTAKRQSILKAAEVSDQKEKNKSTQPSRAVEDPVSTPPSDENEDGQELEQDQLDTLYKKAQSFDFNTPEAEPAETFVMELRKYQKQALHWMLGKEADKRSDDREESMHPLWEQYEWPTTDADDQPLPHYNQDQFYVNPYSGELSLAFPVQEQNCLGGILADEMGLGKTIEMLSLMHSHRIDADLLLESGKTNKLTRLHKATSTVESAPRTTLVVAPMSLLSQWQSEAEKASKPGTMNTLVYYGSDKSANLQGLCSGANTADAPDLIITSYGVVLSEFNQMMAIGGNRGTHGGLFSVEYFRVILDEAHFIKNRQSKTAKACYEISAVHRWALTGTPIVNRLEDLFSLVKFLRVEPWSNFSFWKTFITMPFESKDFIRALDVVQTVLEPLVLRRTKDMKTPEGEALVPLPTRTIEIDRVQLSQAEKDVYDHIFLRTKRTLNQNVEAGTLLKSYATIFAQILRLRQSCCHPVLTRNNDIVRDEEIVGAAADLATGLGDDMDLNDLISRFTDNTEQDANKFGAHVLKQIQEEADVECPICSDEPMVDQAVTSCWHSACKQCLLDFIEHQKEKGIVPRCFNCREPINVRDIFQVIRHDADPDDADKPSISLRRLNCDASAKVTALLAHLKRIRQKDPLCKSVVFSQFTSFLDLIEPALARDRIKFLRFDGSMAQKQRAVVLEEFRAQPKSCVLLLSLRAGGVGLNLTCAKQVFMMDPWWSFAVEAQAIDRVHRMGQESEVGVVRFIVEGSIEEKMLKIQDRKKFLASSLGMMSDEEKKLQRIEDIKELLS
ncbi:hypothetical protein P152DRAFT_455122 [Eremomyces bilateralis CBS 781.70]|uniref:DNA repair protein rad5 n=1 Tax=Eremomyces bilateralis CBS 781.70 TaxID=1392243 RepID=A0A6G1GBE5_9PEZI|nr:uncharacterized protein P152DRAFT_455122 [Eremomyces bilateralis CBS 781.70]KAF1815418.1 hypothetical protein P152DRAFT_455122 [Eremomyces bilateralis CBS 781.70]